MAIEAAISLPLTLDSYGRILISYNPDKVWKDRVLSVLGTHVGERVNRPAFGTLIATSHFTNMNTLEEIITQEVENAFIEFLPLLTLGDITVTEEPNKGTFEVLVEYQLPNNKTDQIVVAIAAIGNKQQPYQERI
jgi:phage baseplate assembly protein W